MTDRYTQSVIEEVLARTDLVALVSEYVQLTRKAGRLFGLCPFHGEKTPSFSVNPDRGFYYCFGCKEHGHAINFLMRMESWGFRDALKELARRAGVELPEQDSAASAEARAAERERQEYFDVLRHANDFFQAQLQSGEHEAPIRYLRERGVEPEIAIQFQLGYAPEAWDRLLQALRRNKLSPEAVARAGLALPRKGGGGYYDRFRDRIMFPIVDRMGHVVAFSGRALGPSDGQKYINSPETSHFKKGEHLFGLQAAKDALRKDRRVILVEGNFDVVTLHAHGFPTALAPLGTALTAAQIGLLKRLAESVVIVFDGDEAGQRAMMKAVAPCYAAELDTRAAALPANEDPDSYVRRHGAKAFRDLIDRARPLAELALDRSVAGAVGQPVEVRVQASKRAAEILSVLPAGPIRKAYEQDVVRRLDLDAGDLDVPRRAGKSARPAGPEMEVPSPAATVAPIRISERERMLLQLVGEEPWLAQRFCDEGRVVTVRRELRGLLGALAEEGERSSVDRLQQLVREQPEPVQQAVIEALAGPWVHKGDTEQAYRLTVQLLDEEHIKRVRSRAMEKISAAERAGDFAQVAEIAAGLANYEQTWRNSTE